MNCNIILKNEKIFEKLLTKSKMIIIIISEQKFEKNLQRNGDGYYDNKFTHKKHRNNR